MLNEPFTQVNATFRESFTLRLMDEIWQRVAEELEARRKGWAWLARRTGWTEQRINNWSRRGVPPRAHAKLSAALGWSVDRLLGVDVTGHLVSKPPSPPYQLPASIESTVGRLGELLAMHGPVRKKTLADVLARFACEPERTELADELVQQLRVPPPPKQAAA